jgi:Coenzyme PQQ synthesis protein D (PqqD)
MTRLRLRTDRLQWVELAEEVVALDEAALTYLSANESGALLWRALGHGATRQQLTDLLVSRFDLAEDGAAADVDRFLHDLQRRGLLEDA